MTVAILALEAQPWTSLDRKHDQAHALFRVSATRYAQAVNAVLDDPEALQLDPVTVNRLRRLREQRQRRRAS